MGTMLFRCFIVCGCVKLFVIGVVFASFAENMTCFQEKNTTWTCNFIPIIIPERYTHFRIVDFLPFKFYAGIFNDKSWRKVKILEIIDHRESQPSFAHFGANCFRGLDNLSELRIEIIQLNHRSFDTFTIFSDLPLVHTLDVTGCYNLDLPTLLALLKSSESIPDLKHLHISRIGFYLRRQLHMDSEFFETVGTRNITYLEAVGLDIVSLNLTSLLIELKDLQYLDLSFSHLVQVNNDKYLQLSWEKLQILNFSYVSLPQDVFRFLPGKMEISDISVRSSSLRPATGRIFKPNTVDFTGVVATTCPATSVWLRNVTIEIIAPIAFNTMHFAFGNNGIKYFDIHFKCSKYKITSLRSFDLSNNGIQMIHASLWSCLPNLEELNLSGNDLSQMVALFPDMFVQWFVNLPKLRKLYLSNNNLTHLPLKTFEFSSKLEYLDLSNNYLQQLHFSFKNLRALKVLDLHKNNIKWLDNLSVNYLSAIGANLKNQTCPDNKVPVIDFDKNWLECSTCDSEYFLSWTLTTTAIRIIPKRLTCVNEIGNSVSVDDDALASVRHICEKPKLIMSFSLAAGGVVAVAVVVAVSVYKYRKCVSVRQNRQNAIDKLRAGEGHFEFAVFVAYSSKDDDIVQTHIIDPLNENLMALTGIHRNLVVTGDCLPPGFNVHNETVKLLQRVATVLVVVSDHFCESPYCQNEFDQAYVLRKPTILLMKGHVNEDLMAPTIRELFKREARVHLREKDGEYTINPCWEIICESFLAKMLDQ